MLAGSICALDVLFAYFSVAFLQYMFVGKLILLMVYQISQPPDYKVSTCLWSVNETRPIMDYVP